ncbi:hypothetical protein [Streptomyces rubellomurinus]|uniref:hypothetical protein n=1 Tax=Streptomyces rubellomurinus (strain ATCC 31215) TaxID=359131 RepID=UPI000AA38888|nr:hypothetical protein [Streptomyces rubellomurinus]
MSRVLLVLCVLAVLCLAAAWVEQLVYERGQARAENETTRYRPEPNGSVPRPGPLP